MRWQQQHHYGQIEYLLHGVKLVFRGTVMGVWFADKDPIGVICRLVDTAQDKLFQVERRDVNPDLSA
jgi:hypothetical protein